jgi:hypothetical protein
MKAKFLDLHNCYSLLPPVGGLPMFARLDECLQGINSQPGVLTGAIDKLIRENQRTSNISTGSARLIASPLDIAQKADLENRGVHTQAVTRPLRGPALYHTVLGYQNGITHKRIVPLQFLLKGWGDASKGFQCYVHSISENLPQSGSPEDLLRFNLRDSGNYYYAGITSRNWLLRLEEHAREMAKGSQRLFYRAWRERFEKSGILFTSFLDDVNRTYEEAMNWEEAKVDKISNDEYGLNMIPGGFKGLRLLHECRIIDDIATTSLEAKDHAIAEYCRRNPRKGLPNPFIAELWKSDDFYRKVIEAREKTLSSDQVKQIRALHAQGKSLLQIVDEVEALNEQQVRNVIRGKTYGRVKS